MEYRVEYSLDKHSRTRASTRTWRVCTRASAQDWARWFCEKLRGEEAGRWRRSAGEEEQRALPSEEGATPHQLYITALDKDWVDAIMRNAILHKPGALPEPSCSTAFTLFCLTAALFPFFYTFSGFIHLSSFASCDYFLCRYVRTWYP